jgi:uncharacterized protein
MSSVAEFKRTLPDLDLLNRPYWTGGAEGKLLIACCQGCRRYIHPPLPRCATCGSRDVRPEPVSGRGRVASCTVNHQAWLPGMPVPFVFAAVELEEQPKLFVFTNIVGCPPESVDAEMPVEVVFEAHEDIHLPMFRPRGSA